MTIIEVQKKLYTIPTEWNELSQQQLLAVMKAFYSNETIDKQLLLLLKALMNVGWYRYCRMSMLHKEEYFYLCLFLLQKNTLTKNLLPSYKGYYGPADDFNNLVGAEFIFCEDYYTRYCESERTQTDLLDKLVAVLYRPGNKKNQQLRGDSRELFNDNLIAAREKKIRKWPMEVKQAILTWYEGCRSNMIAANSEIFAGGGGEPAKYGFLSLFRSIASSGTHGDFEKVQAMYVHMIMMELNEMHEDNKRQEKASSP